MTIEFQNTLDDYREANGIPTRSKRKALLRGMLMSVLTVVLVLLTVAILSMLDGATTSREPFPWRRLMLVLTPSVALFAFFVWALIRQAWKAPEPWNPPPKPSRAPTFRGVGGWLMFFGLAVPLFFLLNRLAPATPAPPGELPPPVQRLPSYFEHLLPLLSWAFFILMLVVFGRIQRWLGIPSTWAAVRHEHEQRVMHTTEAGVVIEQPSARLEYAWGYFAGYRETESLVLLYVSPYAFFMIPKRVFSDPLHLAKFKGLVMSNIPQGHFLPTASNAFPVLPTAPTIAAAAPARDAEPLSISRPPL